MFWDRMRTVFGDAYADSVAKDYVLADLGDRTVNRALADGEDAKVVWRAVCETFNVPDSQRLPPQRPPVSFASLMVPSSSMCLEYLSDYFP